MQLRAPVRITPAAAASAACITMGLLPSLWVSWQAPVVRGLVLPALAILTLALLLPREGAEPEGHADERDMPTDRRLRSGVPRRWRLLFTALRPLRVLAAYPALLLLMWSAICAARVGGVIGSARGVGHGLLPGTADFARGELLRQTAGVAIYLVVATTAREWDRARQMIDALLAAVLGATVMAFATHRPEDPALVGPFGNAQLLAAMLLLLTPLAVVVATCARNGHRRTMAQAATVLGLAALALTQARSAWLGGLAALVVLAVLLSRLPRRRRQRWTGQPVLYGAREGRWPGGPTLVAGVLALGVLGWLVCHTDLSGPVAARAVTLTRISDDEGAAWRLRQWKVALRLARKRPLSGIGLGSYPLAAAPCLPQPIPLAIARAMGPNLSLNAHNFYLQTLVETGAVGLGLYFWVLLAFFNAGLRACRRRDHRSRSLILAACMAGIVGQVVDALGNPAYQFLDVSVFFWALLGLGTAMAQSPLRAVSRESGEERWVNRMAALAGAAILAASSVAGAPPPLNQADYLPVQSFHVQALTPPGYMIQTLLPGECVEMRGVGTLADGIEQDTTQECSFTRVGGTAPADALQQLAPPHANLFCVPAGVPASDNGLSVGIEGTLNFNGQAMTALGPLLCLSVPRACPGAVVTASPQVIPPTDLMVEITVQAAAPGLRFQRLRKVEANEPLGPDDVRVLDDMHLMLRATSSEPGRRIYTLHYQFRDPRNETCMALAQVYVR